MAASLANKFLNNNFLANYFLSINSQFLANNFLDNRIIILRIIIIFWIMIFLSINCIADYLLSSNFSYNNFLDDNLLSNKFGQHLLLLFPVHIFVHEYFVYNINNYYNQILFEIHFSNRNWKHCGQKRNRKFRQNGSKESSWLETSLKLVLFILYFYCKLFRKYYFVLVRFLFQVFCSFVTGQFFHVLSWRKEQQKPRAR